MDGTITGVVICCYSRENFFANKYCFGQWGKLQVGKLFSRTSIPRCVLLDAGTGIKSLRRIFASSSSSFSQKAETLNPFRCVLKGCWGSRRKQFHFKLNFVKLGQGYSNGVAWIPIIQKKETWRVQLVRKMLENHWTFCEVKVPNPKDGAGRGNSKSSLHRDWRILFHATLTAAEKLDPTK